MLENELLSGKWKGEFEYGPEYGNIQGEKASFMLFIDESDENGFKGKAFDIDGVGVNDDVATVKGFFENDTISFIKQYPSTQIFQEDGTLQIIKNKPSPEIHYTGEYSSSRKMFSGEWEMIWKEVANGEGYLEYICTGTWQMMKEAD